MGIVVDEWVGHLIVIIGMRLVTRCLSGLRCVKDKIHARS